MAMATMMAVATAMMTATTTMKTKICNDNNTKKAEN